jgi:general nucleoside transport system ATP-binding protein
MKIELRHIHKRFGAVHANNDINLTFDSRQIVGILGENGAGKSTLMKILSGFQAMDSGEIWLDGKLVRYNGPQAAIAAGIGMLQQDPLDISAFTVLENFIYGQLGNLSPNRKTAQAQLEQLSRRFGFELDPDMPVTQLSIGQRQQLEIVRLLALGVRALILDEPTTGISIEQKTILFDALRELAAKDSMTILLVSHKLEDVITLCHEVAVLRAGRIVGSMDMPATTAQLVTLMFGQELAPQPRQPLQNESADMVLTLDKIQLQNKRVAINNFSLRERAGEIIGLAGLDGSGQEILLRVCVGLEKYSRGQITIAGQDMTGKSYRDFLQSGVAFGAAGRLEEGLVAGLTLTEHMALATSHDSFIDWDHARQYTETQIKQYNVHGQPESLIETLSGGNQQRVLMALMPQQPVLMVLEQPTRGLDVDSSRWIWQQLLASRNSGTAIIFSSPDLDELVTYSDRILVFCAGWVHEVSDVGGTTIDELGWLICGQGVGQ